MKSNIQCLATIAGYIFSHHFHRAFPFRQEKRRIQSGGFYITVYMAGREID
jgi:hypothetical protein